MKLTAYNWENTFLQTVVDYSLVGTHPTKCFAADKKLEDREKSQLIEFFDYFRLLGIPCKSSNECFIGRCSAKTTMSTDTSVGQMHQIVLKEEVQNTEKADR